MDVTTVRGDLRFDPGSETMKPAERDRVRSLLAPIPDLMSRYYVLLLELPTPGSRADEDGVGEVNELVFATSAAAWNSGAGHLDAWRLLLERGIQPERAHYTLARAAIEGAVTARWLVDPKVRARTRRQRAGRLQLEDYDERRKWEDAMMEAAGRTDRPSAFNASIRSAAFQKLMTDAGLEPGQPMDMTDRVKKYAGETWVYRSLCAFAHSLSWSAFFAEVRSTDAAPGFGGVKLARVTSKASWTATVAERAIQCLATALQDLEAYKREHDRPGVRPRDR